MFPKLGLLFGGPHNKDYSILGSTLGPPYLGKLPNEGMDKQMSHSQSKLLVSALKNFFSSSLNNLPLRSLDSGANGNYDVVGGFMGATRGRMICRNSLWK